MLDNRVFELLESSLNNQIEVYTNFLTPNLYLEIPERYYDIKVFSFGEIRKIYAFIPEYIMEWQFPISLIKITVNNKFIEYEHKDFLGAIMALNIKREYIGDLYVEKNIAYVYVNNNIKDVLKNELKEIGKNNCIVDEINENLELKLKYEKIKINVNSIRLDSVVSAITKLSRDKSKQYIEFGLVKVNYEICENSSKQLKEDYIITIKKYGKYIIKNIERITKKNRIVLNINKFI